MPELSKYIISHLLHWHVGHCLIVFSCILFETKKKLSLIFFYRYPRRRQESTGRATVVVDLTESDDGRSKVKGSHFLPLYKNVLN